MEIGIIIIGIGLWIASIKSAEKRIAELKEDYENYILLLKYYLQQAYLVLPKKENDLKEQIGLVLDEEDNSED